MKKPVMNISASILARLRNQSDEMNRPFRGRRPTRDKPSGIKTSGASPNCIIDS